MFFLRLSAHAPLMHRRWRGRDTRAGWAIIHQIFFKEAWEASSHTSMYLRRDSLLHMPQILIHKAQQHMLASHGLAHMSNARLLRLHPGVHHRFQRRHRITTLGAIKALELIHRFSSFRLPATLTLVVPLPASRSPQVLTTSITRISSSSTKTIVGIMAMFVFQFDAGYCIIKSSLFPSLVQKSLEV